MKNILVTGRRRITSGSHVVEAPRGKGYRPLVYDDLSGGFKDFVNGP